MLPLAACYFDGAVIFQSTTALSSTLAARAHMGLASHFGFSNLHFVSFFIFLSGWAFVLVSEPDLQYAVWPLAVTRSVNIGSATLISLTSHSPYAIFPDMRLLNRKKVGSCSGTAPGAHCNTRLGLVLRPGKSHTGSATLISLTSHSPNAIFPDLRLLNRRKSWKLLWNCPRGPL